MRSPSDDFNEVEETNMSATRVIRHTRTVLAYVTSGDRLLVEEGIDAPRGRLRVPTRMVTDGTSPKDAAFEELHGKAGLEVVTLREKLGHYSYDMAPMLEELQERHVFWFEYSGERRDAWRASNPGTADAGSEMYYWIDLQEIPDLFAGHGRYLDELRTRLVGPPAEAVTIDEHSDTIDEDSEAWPSDFRERI